MAEIFSEKFGPILGNNAEAVLHDWFDVSQRHVETTTLACIEAQAVGFLTVSPTMLVNGVDERYFWQALRQQYNPLQAAWRLGLLALLDSDYRTHAHELYIEMIGTAPSWRGHGVAQQLMAHAEQVARQRQVNHISLSVLSGNQVALRFYEQQGFRRLRLRPNRWLRWRMGHAGYYRMVKSLT